MLTHKGTQTIETSRLLLRRAARVDAQPMFRNWVNIGHFSFQDDTEYTPWNSPRFRIWF